MVNQCFSIKTLLFDYFKGQIKKCYFFIAQNVVIFFVSYEFKAMSLSSGLPKVRPSKKLINLYFLRPEIKVH